MVCQYERARQAVLVAAWADLGSCMGGLDGPGPQLSAVNGRAQCATAVISPMEAVWTQISRRLMLREAL